MAHIYNLWTADVKCSPRRIVIMVILCGAVELVETGCSIDHTLHFNWSTPLPASRPIPHEPDPVGTLLPLTINRCTRAYKYRAGV